MSITQELEKVFQSLNASLFSGKLKPVQIAIQTKKKVSIRWMPDSNALIVGADFPKIEYSEIPNFMLHEMVHIYNAQNGIVDVTANQYHNKSFLQAALNVGLVVIKHKTQGWGITSTIYPRNVVESIYVKRPQKEDIALREAAFSKLNIDKTVFKTARTEIRERLRREKPPKTYFLKYQCNCPPPHNSIRSGRRPDGQNALNIQCLNCRSHFECVSDLEE